MTKKASFGTTPKLAFIYFALKTIYNPSPVTKRYLKQAFVLFLVKNINLNTAGLHHILRQLIGIRIGVNNTLDARVDENLGAHHTGLVRAIQRAPIHGYTVIGSLHHRVLLRMDAAAQLVVLAGGHLQLLAQSAHLAAMGQILRRAVIARGHNLAIFDNHRAHTTA